MKRYINGVKLTFNNLRNFLPLLQSLIVRDLKKKYRGSALGYLWCVLNPLFTMIIMTLVFSLMFKNNIKNYPVYLFTGRMIFSFISGSTQKASRSIISNGSLIRKARIPNYIFTLSSVFSDLVDLGFTFIAFVLVLIGTQTKVTIHCVLFPVIVIEIFLFSFGLGLFLAQATVFVRDVSYIYAVVITALTYLTPLFYPVESLPDIMQHLISTYNPIQFYIVQTRDIFLYNTWPDGFIMLKGFAVAILMCGIGMWRYHQRKNDFVLYI